MFGWIESYLRQIAGKHASNLPDCITCIYAQAHLQPDVIATEIKDPTKTNKIGNGKGVVELQARVIIYRSSTRTEINGKGQRVGTRHRFPSISAREFLKN